MNDYETEAKKQELMISRFDETLLLKSNKTQIAVLYDHIEKNYASSSV